MTTQRDTRETPSTVMLEDVLATRLTEAAILMEQITERLDRLACARHPHWGHAGELGDLVEILREAAGYED